MALVPVSSSFSEDRGIPSVEVQFVDIRRKVHGGDIYLGLTDVEVRRYGERSGFETPVVHTENDKC